MKHTGFLVVLLLHQACSLLDVVVPPFHNALIGSTILLPCSFTVDNPPINPSFLAILWYFGDKMLLTYDSKGKISNLRMTINEQAATRGNASLYIHNVTISDQGTYKCLVIYSPYKQGKEILLNTQAAPVVKINKKALLKNEKSILLCSILSFFPRDITVMWLRNGQALNGSVLLEFQENGDGTYNVNSSVTITPIQTKDNPLITCQVEHESLRNPIQDDFRVEYGVAPKVTLLASNDGDGQTFVCEARGFSPEAVAMKWLLDGKRTEPPRRNDDGSFNDWHFYRIDGKQKKRIENISCVVEHETLYNSLIETLEVKGAESEKDPQTTSLIVAILMTMLLTLSVTAVTLWYLIYKKKYLQRFQVSHIHREPIRTDNKVTLYCMALNCPEYIQVTWIITENGGKMVIVSDNQTYSDGESYQLLKTYTMKIDESEMDGLHNFTTTLSFTPTVSKHKNMEVVCKILCDGKSRERSLQWSFNSSKPQPSGPIKLSLCDSGDVICSITLEKFYPRDIQIKWRCGVGHYQELDTAKDNVINNSEYTSNITSECQVSHHLFKDRGFRVCVTWSHESLDCPENRDVFVTDFPWIPVMEEIITPQLQHNTEAKLQCRISGYFPGDLDVKWLRREAGNQDLYEVSPDDKYKIPVMEITQESDKTYTCTAGLIVSVSAVTEHGSEFICRVRHPTLKTPLEKRTGELTVAGIPVVRNVLQDSRYLILEVDSFYPQEPEVTWERADSECGPYERIPDSSIQNQSTESNNDEHRFTSTCEAMRRFNIMDVKKKYFKAVVKHGALRSPVEIRYIHTKGNFHVISENGKLQQVNQKTMNNSNSSHHHKSTEGFEVEVSDKKPVW